MTYAFAPRGAPTVGKGLGGLPQRTDSEIITTTVLGSCVAGDYIYTATGGYPSLAFRSLPSNGIGPGTVNFSNRVSKGGIVLTEADIGTNYWNATYNAVTNQYIISYPNYLWTYNANLTLANSVYSANIGGGYGTTFAVNPLTGDFVQSLNASADTYRPKFTRFDKSGTILGNVTISATQTNIYTGAQIQYHPATGNILTVWGESFTRWATFYANGQPIVAETYLVPLPASYSPIMYYPDLKYNPYDYSWVYTYRDQSSPLTYAGYFLIQSGNAFVKSPTLFSNVQNYSASRVAFNSSNGDFMICYQNASGYPTFQMFNRFGNVTVSETVIDSVAISNSGSSGITPLWMNNTQQFAIFYISYPPYTLKMANYSNSGTIVGTPITITANAAVQSMVYTGYVTNQDEYTFFNTPNYHPTLSFISATISSSDYYLAGIAIDAAPSINQQSTVRVLRSGTPTKGLAADFRAAHPKGVAIGTGTFK